MSAGPPAQDQQNVLTMSAGPPAQDQ